MYSQDLYQKAIDFSANAHKDQKFPGKDYSYIVHPFCVCMEVIFAIFHSKVDNPDLAIQCALLHDTIEDTKITYEDIEKNFGKDVADGVLALTKNKDLDKNQQIEDSLKRILTQPKEIGMVKLADRITNLQEPPYYWDNNRKLAYLNDAKMIYNYLKNCNDYLAERLKQKIEDYRNYIISEPIS